MLHSWIIFSQVPDLISIFAELQKVLASPLFQPVQVFLQGGSPLQSVYLPTWFGIIGKLYQGTLDPVIQITEEKLNSVGHTIVLWGIPLVTGGQLEKELFTTLGAAEQPVPHLPHRPLVQTVT